MKARPSIVWGLAGAMAASDNTSQIVQGGYELASRSVGALAWRAVAASAPVCENTWR